MKKIDINKIIDNGDATKVDNVTVLDVNNYNLFSILECNREINEKQVNKLKKLIAKNGYLPSSFVLVDEFFNIVEKSLTLERIMRGNNTSTWSIVLFK